MAITATTTAGAGNFEKLEPGTYLARCYSLIHTGTNDETILGETKTLNKVRIAFELPTELVEFKEGEGEKPYSLSKDFTLSLHEKSALRPFLESWRGKSFTEAELKGFDLCKLIGAPCMVSVIHKQAKNGKTYLEIAGVSKVAKGLTMPEQFNESFIFDFEENFSIDKVNALPDFISEKIFSSKEFNALMNKDEGQPEEIEAVDLLEPTDDLPF